MPRFRDLSHANIIEQLGNPAVLGRDLGLDHFNPVHQWKRRGIPPHWWEEICRVATSAGFSLTPRDLARTSPRPRARLLVNTVRRRSDA